MILRFRFFLEKVALAQPALFLLLAYIFGHTLEYVGLVIPLIIFWSTRRASMGLMLMASVTWGWTQGIHQQNNEVQWSTWSKEEGYLPCRFQWLEDVYPAQGSWVKGWASVVPTTETGPCFALERRVYLSCPVEVGVDNYFYGVTWQGYIALKKGDSLKYLKTGHARNLTCSILYVLRRDIILVLEKNWTCFPIETRGFIRSLLTGNRREISDALRQHYTRLGLMALLAISGLHLALVYGVVLKSLELLTWLLRLKTSTVTIFRPAFWAFLAVALYALLGAWTPPLLRAFGMLALAKLALPLGRRYGPWNVLFFMAWFELVLHPSSWGGVSFLLTYSGVAGIFWFRQCWSFARIPKYYKAILQSYGLSWGAMLWTWPLSVWYFGTFPSWAWLFAPIFFVSFGMVMFYVLMLSFLSLGMNCPEFLTIPLTQYHDMLEYFSQNGAWVMSVPPGAVGWLVLYYGALLVFLWAQNKDRKA